jgi:hypothetical protein
MVLSRRCATRSFTAPSLDRHLSGRALGTTDNNGVGITSKLYGKLDDGSQDSSENLSNALSWKDVPTLQRPEDDTSLLTSTHGASCASPVKRNVIDDIASVNKDGPTTPKAAGLFNFLNTPKRMLGRMRSTPSISSANSSAVSQDILLSEACANETRIAEIKVRPEPRRSASALALGTTARRNSHIKPNEASLPLTRHAAEKSPESDATKPTNSERAKPRLSVVVKASINASTKQRSSAKKSRSVPKEITLLEQQAPISPLRNPKFAVRPSRSSASSSEAKSKSRRPGHRRPRSESVGPSRKTRPARNNDSVGGGGDTSSVASESGVSTSSSRRSRQDPPAPIRRTSSRDSVSLLYRLRRKDDAIEGDEEEDDNESLWSDCPSTSQFTSCGVADDQSTISDASILFEHAVSNSNASDSKLQAKDNEPEVARVSPSRRFSVDNGVLADISRQLYHGDTKLSNSFLLELDDDDNEDEAYNTSYNTSHNTSCNTSFNTSLSSTQRGAPARGPKMGERRIDASQQLQEQHSVQTLQSEQALSDALVSMQRSVEVEEEDDEDHLHSSYLHKTSILQFESLSSSCPQLVTHTKPPPAATIIAGHSVKIESFDGSLPELHVSLLRSESLPLAPSIDSTSLLKPKRRPKSALTLDKDATRKKKQSKRKDRAKSVEVYE